MNQADTAWMLISTALVLLMTPALAFFYGGLVRSKNALNTMMMSFISLGFVGVLWALVGYSLALTAGQQLDRRPVARVPATASASRRPARSCRSPSRTCSTWPSRATFCIITAALISGAIVERMRFSAYVGVHLPLVGRRLRAARALGVGRRLAGRHGRAGTSPAAPSCTSTPASPRWSRRSSSASAQDYRSSSLLPHNVPFVLLGAGLLWFGWFGFNAGSALAASPIAGLAFVTTMLAPAATLVVWTFLDMMRSGKPTAVGARHGDRRRPGGGHAGGRLHQPDERDHPRRHRGGPELHRAAAFAPRRRSTTRSTSSRRTASAARSARC